LTIIRDDVCDWLTEAADVDASIEVQVAAGVVTLSGAVENRYAKRRAEDLAESVSGVREVQNNLRLRSSGDAPRDRSQEHSGR
jgi:osmotically-inducible protein OsmY